MRGRRLVLGYDGGCAACSALAQRIEEAVGDKLEVRSLHEPQVEHWREQALGKDAPWAPTLIEVENHHVNAWIGLRMGVALSLRLGIRGTWRIMKALGANTEPEGISTQARPSFSRARFLKGLGGVALAVSVLSGTEAFAKIANAAAWVHPLNRKRVVSSEPLKGEDLREAIARATASKDVKNVWPESPPAPDRVVGARHTYTDGNTVTSVSWVVGSQLLIYFLPARAIGNYRSQAMRIEVIPEEAYVLKATSVNGRQRSVVAAAGAASNSQLERGCGCCRWSWGCVATVGSACVSCAKQCAECVATPAKWACGVCLSCALVGCPVGIRRCCRNPCG
ncbi:hypothetical protein Rxycam_02114 [Rubrobacter xylanophilus DSM 9941]|uniref:hypothetical protein n=1 Tax=Rubrobacter xylanophilus TaxID=49319 RepID=UPI001C63E482|nr:hypothetical protein [Rubrobacter xylanophilus]QYJ16281.1 hypothetical protein Rxycam_02114 [Rubrobacter xylanophilus DSM 9941]